MPRARTNNDLNTPAWILDLVRQLAPIGLDPCSNPWSKVGAQVAWTVEDDGLPRSWSGYGLVFVNPPYGRGHMPRWADKIAQEDAEIVSLVKGDFSTRWWDVLFTSSDAICYLAERVSFDGGAHGSGNFASALFYKGPRPDRFCEIFAHKGDTRLLSARPSPITHLHTSTERTYKMNINNKITIGDCAAKRCRGRAVSSVDGKPFDMEGVQVPFCARHLRVAQEEHGAVTELVPAEVEDEKLEEEISYVAQEASEALAFAQQMQIEDQDDLDLAAEYLAEVKGRVKRLKARLDEITKPLNAGLKSARALFKPAMDLHLEIEKELKARIAEHALRQDEKNRQAQLEAAAALGEGDEDGANEALATVTTVESVDGVQIRRSWGFEIEDADLVPREFLIIDEKAINAHARSFKADEEPEAIPGIRFVLNTSVASRSA